MVFLSYPVKKFVDLVRFNEHFARFAPIGRTDESGAFKFVHESARAGIPYFHAALQE
jgi:hypothetical protein